MRKVKLWFQRLWQWYLTMTYMNALLALPEVRDVRVLKCDGVDEYHVFMDGPYDIATIKRASEIDASFPCDQWKDVPSSFGSYNCGECRNVRIGRSTMYWFDDSLNPIPKEVHDDG